MPWVFTGHAAAGSGVVHVALEGIVDHRLQRDVDANSPHQSTPSNLFDLRQVVELLQERGADDIVVFGGGIIPEDDIPALKQAGIAEVFGPGTYTKDIIDYVGANVKR